MAQTIVGVPLVPVRPGNDYSVGGLFGRPLLGLPIGQTITQASFFLQRFLGDNHPLTGFPAKVVTPSYTPGMGMIVNPGMLGLSGAWLALVRFDLPASQTILLAPCIRYEYHIDVVTSLGMTFTAEAGYLPTIG